MPKAKSKKFKLSNEDKDKFLLLVSKNPCLYNGGSAEHRDKGLLENTWDSIAKIMGYPNVSGEY